MGWAWGGGKRNMAVVVFDCFGNGMVLEMYDKQWWKRGFENTGEMSRLVRILQRGQVWGDGSVLLPAESSCCVSGGRVKQKKHFPFYTSEDLRGFGKVSGSIRSGLEVVACREVMLCHQREKRPVSVSLTQKIFLMSNMCQQCCRL